MEPGLDWKGLSGGKKGWSWRLGVGWCLLNVYAAAAAICVRSLSIGRYTFAEARLIASLRHDQRRSEEQFGSCCDVNSAL